MSMTNFAQLTDTQKIVWSREVWKMARNASFINQFAGSGSNSLVTRITELTKTERGHQAIFQLVADLESDGVAGDNQLEGNEEEIKNYDHTITIDQLRNASRHKGRMSEQKNVINFREQARDVLAYWLADRIDQMAFLTLSGLAYTNTNNGGTRTGSQLPDLAFNDDITTPTTGRHYQNNNGALSTTLNTEALITAEDKPSYELLVNLKAQAKESYIRGIRTRGNGEMYHLFMTPTGLARLKMDSDFIANVRNAGVRGSTNPLFAGTQSYMTDGIMIHEFRHVYSNSTWGAADEGGERMLLCGAQALGMADIGMPGWTEKGHDYDNQQAIAVDKIFGLLKPRFYSIYSSQVEDFGVIAVDVAH